MSHPDFKNKQIAGCECYWSEPDYETRRADIMTGGDGSGWMVTADCPIHAPGCRKEKERGEQVFTLVAQDHSSPRVICEWIKENIETAPPEKLVSALLNAISMRDSHSAKKEPASHP